MKKIVALLVSLCMLVSPVFAEVDLSSITDSELLELKEQVNEEIATRKCGDLIPVGVYVTGKDIKEGHFVITSTNDSCYYALFNTEEDYEEGNIERNGILKTGSDVYIDLSDNVVLEIRIDSFVIEESNSIWSPEA